MKEKDVIQDVLQQDELIAKIKIVRDVANQRRDKEYMKEKRKKKKTKTERSKGNRSYSEKVRLNDFVVHLTQAFSC